MAQGILFDFGGDGNTNGLSQGLVAAWDSGTPIEECPVSIAFYLTKHKTRMMAVVPSLLKFTSPD